MPDTIYVLRCTRTGQEWEFDSYSKLCEHASTMSTEDRINCATILRSMYR